MFNEKQVNSVNKLSADFHLLVVRDLETRFINYSLKKIFKKKISGSKKRKFKEVPARKQAGDIDS